MTNFPEPSVSAWWRVVQCEPVFRSDGLRMAIGGVKRDTPRINRLIIVTVWLLLLLMCSAHLHMWQFILPGGKTAKIEISWSRVGEKWNIKINVSISPSIWILFAPGVPAHTESHMDPDQDSEQGRERPQSRHWCLATSQARLGPPDTRRSDSCPDPTES